MRDVLLGGCAMTVAFSATAGALFAVHELLRLVERFRHPRWVQCPECVGTGIWVVTPEGVVDCPTCHGSCEITVALARELDRLEDDLDAADQHEAFHRGEAA